MLRRIIASGVFLLMATPAFNCCSGLMIIPTADTVGAGKFSTEMQMDGQVNGLGDNVRLVNMQFGLGERIETGVDFDYSTQTDTRSFWNAKYVFSRTDTCKSATAIGVTNVGSHLSPSPYVVTSRELGYARLHLGAMQIDRKSRWFVGIDRTIGNNWTVMADFTNGSENFSSVGLNYQFNDNFGLMAGMEFPNTGNDSMFSVHIVWGGSCVRGGRG